MSRATRFCGRAASRLIIGLIVFAGCSLPSWSALAASRPHLRFAIPASHSDALVMIWSGKIAAPMSDEINAAFQLNKERVKVVELKLDSAGGSVKEGERVIEVLREIKKTHLLYTAVGPGKRCGSMCVFIYVQGQRRLAAPASLWLFHEVSFKDRITHKLDRLDRERWEKLVDKYWVPAGVSPAWIADVKTHTNSTDYWQSGDSLLKNGSNVIHKPLSDEKRRVIPAARDESATVAH